MRRLTSRAARCCRCGDARVAASRPTPRRPPVILASAVPSDFCAAAVPPPASAASAAAPALVAAPQAPGARLVSMPWQFEHASAPAPGAAVPPPAAAARALERCAAYSPEPFGDAYTLGELLGSGSHGTVRAAAHRSTGRRVAVKVLARRRNRVDRTAAIENEIAMSLQLAGCPSVAALLAVHADPNSVYIVQELLIGGSLQSLIDSRGGGPFQEPEAAAVVRGVLRALATVHERGIVYGDVKPQNFVLASLYPSVAHLADAAAPRGAPDVRLVDLGCARPCSEARGPGGLSGTIAYMAPETAAAAAAGGGAGGSSGYGAPADLWGAGVLMHQLLTGFFPQWPQAAGGGGAGGGRLVPAARAALADVAAGTLRLDTPAFAGLSDAARDLLRALLSRDPDARPAAARALEHPWFAAAAAADGAPGPGAAAA